MTRRRHSSSFKAKVAIDAIRGEKTIAEIAALHQVHPGQVQVWKAEALEKFTGLFDKGNTQGSVSEAQLAALERKVGQLAIENDFLKKSWEGYSKRTGKK